MFIITVKTVYWINGEAGYEVDGYKKNKNRCIRYGDLKMLSVGSTWHWANAY